MARPGFSGVRGAMPFSPTNESQGFAAEACPGQKEYFNVARGFTDLGKWQSGILLASYINVRLLPPFPPPPPSLYLNKIEVRRGSEEATGNLSFPNRPRLQLDPTDGTLTIVLQTRGGF